MKRRTIRATAATLTAAETARLYGWPLPDGTDPVESWCLEHFSGTRGKALPRLFARHRVAIEQWWRTNKPGERPQFAVELAARETCAAAFGASRGDELTVDSVLVAVAEQVGTLGPESRAFVESFSRSHGLHTEAEQAEAENADPFDGDGDETAELDFTRDRWPGSGDDSDDAPDDSDGD